jgi:hypothetical protein
MDKTAELARHAFYFDLWARGVLPVAIHGTELPPYSPDQDRAWPKENQKEEKK